mmetsp:Transcript_65249/g.199596  ORF Transcript_65249/g.199596 Transcript_65249/m.199596 type:complete len:226 (+) Transcript_65249:1096-1773(+)
MRSSTARHPKQTAWSHPDSSAYAPPGEGAAQLSQAREGRRFKDSLCRPSHHASTSEKPSGPSRWAHFGLASTLVSAHCWAPPRPAAAGTVHLPATPKAAQPSTRSHSIQRKTTGLPGCSCHCSSKHRLRLCSCSAESHGADNSTAGAAARAAGPPAARYSAGKARRSAKGKRSTVKHRLWPWGPAAHSCTVPGTCRASLASKAVGPPPAAPSAAGKASTTSQSPA